MRHQTTGRYHLANVSTVESVMLEPVHTREPCWATALRRGRAGEEHCSRGAVWPDTEVASTCALNKQKLDPFILVRFYPSLLRQYGLKYKEGSLMYFKYTVNSKIMWEYFSTLIF